MNARHALAAALFALAAAACGPTFDYRRAAKPARFGEESPADINLTNPNLLSASRKVTLLGEGKLTVEVKATNGQAKYYVKVLPEAAGALPVAEGDPPLEAEGVPAGTYFVWVRPMNAVSTRVKINIGYQPKDPDQESGADKSPDGANALAAGQTAKGSVSYYDLDRTDYFSFNSPGGSVKADVKVAAEAKGKISATLLPPKGGEAVPADPRNGASVQDGPAGTYLLKVQADEGASGGYVVTITNEAGDPDKNSGDDLNQEGANVMNFKPGTPPSLVATAKDEVNFDKGDATDWFSFTAPDKGNCGVVLKPKDRASKIKAEFVAQNGRDDGDRIRSGFAAPCGKGPSWIKVYAENRGDGTPYTLEVTYTPSVFINAKVLELDKRAGCAVWVDKGANDQVRQGAPASVVNAAGLPLAQGSVDQVQPRMSHVRVFGSDCNFAGQQVQIQGGF